MNQKENTIVGIVKKKIERLSKQEERIDIDIKAVQKRIDNIPNLKKRLEELKQKKAEVANKKQAELKDIAELQKYVK